MIKKLYLCGMGCKYCLVFVLKYTHGWIYLDNPNGFSESNPLSG